MKLTLVELALKHKNGISENLFAELLEKIEIFEPIKSEDSTEDTIYSNGNKNSLAEVEFLVFDDDYEGYRNFLRDFNKYKN